MQCRAAALHCWTDSVCLLSHPPSTAVSMMASLCRSPSHSVSSVATSLLISHPSLSTDCCSLHSRISSAVLVFVVAMIYSTDSPLYHTFLIFKAKSSTGKTFETGGKKVTVRERGSGMEDGRSG